MAIVPNESLPHMDVDIDGANYAGHGSLKRYNSAPYINIPGVEFRPNCESSSSAGESAAR